MFRRIIALLLIFCLCLPFSGCAPKEPGKIYIYGENHINPDITVLELELWQSYYHDQGMRHLFIEYSYFHAAFLNIWMQAEDDSILIDVYNDLVGTQAHTEITLNFFRTIKETCPETIFHGTDVGHQFNSTGKRYLEYLEAHDLTDTKEYQLTVEAIDQGKLYYGSGSQDHVYRENTMAENFIREYEALDGENIMGIYGTAHIYLDRRNHTGECDSMGKQLASCFGELITSEDLSPILQENAQPLRTETITIGKKDYTAEYFGSWTVSESYFGYSEVEFWRLPDAYEAFSKSNPNGTFRGGAYYPFPVEEGGAYVVQFLYSDGRKLRTYYLCDGMLYDGVPVTKEISGSAIG